MSDDRRVGSPTESAKSDEPFDHVPVMLEHIAAYFRDLPAGLVVDATLGGGGHAEAILLAAPQLQLLGIDQDDMAIGAATRRLAQFGDRVTIVNARFDAITEVVEAHLHTSHHRATPCLVGVLFDLGVSSPQLDRADRGFSYRQEGPLDMRMSRSQPLTAATIVNTYPAEELASLLDRYGDERFARRIAAAVVSQRPIETTTELAEIVRTAIPAAARRKGGHPAKRTFQALRIETNEELAILGTTLEQAIDLLLPGGRCVAMSYHSGEDKIVKDRFRQAETGGCVCPPKFGCVCGAEPKVRLLRRGAVKADAAELERNPRSESVRIRAVESVRFLPRAELAKVKVDAS